MLTTHQAKLFASIEVPLKASGFDTRMVGGAVRDHLLGKVPSDMDFATSATPQQVIDTFSKIRYKTIPTGIDHGTVTVVSPHGIGEVTTLRRDVETDGRHATVEYTDSWEEDAARRDFTINAMSMDRSGDVHDYFGGRDDLEAGIVRFVGDPEKRIDEDHLRIMRYFRFLARTRAKVIDKESDAAVYDMMGRLSTVSSERIWSELKKILETKTIATMITMVQYGVFQAIGLSVKVGTPYWTLAKYINLSKSANVEPHDYLLLFAALLGTVEELDVARKVLKLSNEEYDVMLYVLRMDADDVVPSDDWIVERCVRGDRHSYIIAYLKFSEHFFLLPDGIDFHGWDIPVFDIDGNDMVGIGLKGKKIGEALEVAKELWIMSDYSYTRETIIEAIAAAKEEAGFE